MRGPKRDGKNLVCQGVPPATFIKPENVNQDSDKDSKVSTNEAAIVLKNDEFRAIQQNVLENEKDVRDSLDELQ